MKGKRDGAAPPLVRTRTVLPPPPEPALPVVLAATSSAVRLLRARTSASTLPCASLVPPSCRMSVRRSSALAAVRRRLTSAIVRSGVSGVPDAAAMRALDMETATL